MVNTACVVSSIGNGCSDSIRVSSICYWGSSSIHHWGNSRLNVDIGLCSNFFMNIWHSCRGLLRSRGSSSSSNHRQQDKELHY